MRSSRARRKGFSNHTRPTYDKPLPRRTRRLARSDISTVSVPRVEPTVSVVRSLSEQSPYPETAHITPLPGNHPVASGAFIRDGASTELGPAPNQEALEGQTGGYNRVQSATLKPLSEMS